MKKNLSLLLLLLFSILLPACGTTPTSTSAPTPTIAPTATRLPFAQPPVTWQYKGASLAGYWHDSYAQPNAFDTVDYLSGLGVSHVALIVSWYQADMQATEIFPRYERETATDESLQAIIRYIHSQGMGVMLKPHIEPDQDWIGKGCQEEGSRCWRGVIDPKDHAQWFESFGQFILHYAQIAEQEKVELFSIGTEMPSMTLDAAGQARWADLAGQVRQVYHQKLLYSAHEYEVLGGYYEIEEAGIKYEFPPLPASFWEPFDYAGTTVYYDIQNLEQSDAPAPEADLLAANWLENPARHEKQRRLLDSFRQWQAGHGKPVIFSEIGYRSIDYAALHPYTTVGPNLEGLSSAYNEIAQANAYLAALKALGNAEWLAGAFWWQFIPNAADRRECGQDVDPSQEKEASYTPCGKQAASVLSQWYRGSQPETPPAYVPLLPDLLNLEQLNNENLIRRWRAQTSGELTFNLDANVHLEGQSRSLHMLSNLPCSDQRYSQLDYLFTTPQDFSQYRSLTISARAALPESRGELTVSLLEADGTEWQSANWLAGEQWREFKIALRAGSAQKDDPWMHPTEFVVANWFETDPHNPVTAPYELDLTQIAGIRLKALTVTSDCAATPQFETWVGQMTLSKEEVLPAIPSRLPVIDTFDYANQAELQKVWQVIKAPNAQVYYNIDAAEGSNPSLSIYTNLSCEQPRYAFLVRRFPRLLDFSPYTTLQLRVRGDGIDQEPWGGEFSIVLWDASGASEELWQSSGWLNRQDGWQKLDIRLSGKGQGDPFQHRRDFIVPGWETLMDGFFNLTRIAGIGIKLNTVDNVCQEYPEMESWIDDLILR